MVASSTFIAHDPLLRMPPVVIYPITICHAIGLVSWPIIAGQLRHSKLIEQSDRLRPDRDK